ncbi:hypothetical protein [Escherichia coli]|uniref:hypothetical protein n=1 Tax=Escherichia coli TaxID=562 RepID=UPI0010BC06E7|nr:hypothetical protein [Escherichia coli]GCK26045.1 hypothetical protein BvCmsB32A_02701 [Escherichia coli]
MNNMDIVKAVKDGMKKSADATYLMDFRSGAKINTEYVATVSIGLSLLEIKSFRHGDYKVIFEYHTNKFINATVPLSKRSDPQKYSQKKLSEKTQTQQDQAELILPYWTADHFSTFQYVQ